MGKKKSKKISKIIQFGQNDEDENTKYVLPIDEFDMHFLQLNYNKLKDKNNDHAVPVWSVQQNVFDNNYYEFEIVGESNGTCHHGSSSATDETSTDYDTAMEHTVTRLTTINEEVDFTTYMKLVNVFNESEVSITGSVTEQTSSLKENVVKDNTPEAKIVEHYTAAKLEVVNNNGHQVTLRVSSGEEVKVSMNNFHGFWTSGDRVQCRVCMMMVNDVEAHKMEIRHMKRIAPILKDVHCIRKIGPIFNHCVLCNEVIENIEFHLKANDAHTKQLEEALKLCKSTTGSQNNIVKSYLLNVAGTSITDSNSTSPSTIDSFKCLLDTSLILNKKSPIEINIKESKSSSKPGEVKNISSTNKSNNFVSCDVCDRKMHINTLKSHIEGKYHKYELLKQSKHIKSTAAGKNCHLPSVSGVNIDLNSEMSDSSANDVVSTKIADSRIQSDVQYVVADPRPKYDTRNKITDPRVLNRVVGNNRSIQPVEKIQSTVANDYPNINSKMTVNVTNVQYNNYNIQKRHSSHAGEIKTVEEYSPLVKPYPVLYCFKCHETVYFDIGNMIYYVKDCCMTAIFYKHHMRIEGSTNCIAVYCDLCGVDCSSIRNITELYEHIITPGHISRFKNTSAFSSNHKICDMMSRYLYNTLRCQVCMETVDNSVYGVMFHLLESDYHKSIFEKLLLGNKIVEIGGYLQIEYWCELCKTNLLNQEQLYSHIYTDNHERKLNKTKNMTFTQKALISSGFFLICFITYKYFLEPKGGA